MTTFRVGQRVVCIGTVNDLWYDPDTSEPSAGPVKGDILMITAISKAGLMFAEWPDDGEDFDKTAFKPIVETSIEIFQKMLLPKKKKVSA